MKNNPNAYQQKGQRYHDELDFQPSTLHWKCTTIPSFKLKNDQTKPPIREPAPESKIPGTMITPALAAALIIDKHCDHLPHHRQSTRFFREQTVDISRKTINSWVQHTATHLSPIAEAIGKELSFKGTIQCDGYICYETVMNTFQGIKLGACLAHIRRKFIEDKSLKQ